MREHGKIGVVILAAGASRRLGKAKQLVKFRGIPLVQHSIDLAESIALAPRILILGARGAEIVKEINCRSFEVLINEKWEQGMSTSISKGVSEALKRVKDLEHILILLCDQPLVTRTQVEELIKVQLANKTRATFSEYAGEPGVPAIFSREVFPELLNLQGDQGARKLIRDKGLEYGTVVLENGSFDVDTPADVELLKEMEKG